MKKRLIEIYSAGCTLCEDTVKLVESLTCPSCEVKVLDMNKKEVAAKAKKLGINKVPAIVVDGKLAECCTSKKPSKTVLKKLGVGRKA